MLLKSPQYGANEASVIRINNEQPRYIRITDIDENGTLSKELGATAETIDSKYILNNNDILFARSGATVGKTYIHKVKKINYKAFFAGYMIRFIVNPDIIIPDFLFIYTQLSVYKKWVKATQRAAGQPNINAEEYKSLKIPLPPLEIQQQIVDLYKKAYSEKQQKEAEAQRLLDSIDDYLLGELGITLPKEEELLPQNTDKNNSYNLDNDNPLVKKGRLFLTNLSEVTGKRIDPDYNSKMTYLFSNKGFYNHILLKELITKQPQYGANEEAKDFENDTDIRYIRITDIDELGDLKNNNKKTANKIETKYFLNYNDLLFARSGSVGRCYIHKKTNEISIFAGYLIRFIVNTDICNPDYIFYYCNSKFYKLWVSAIERPAVQSNINTEEYKSLPIPLPSLEKQNEIATHISQIRSKANTLKQEGKEILEQAKQEVEQMILGN